MKDMKCKCGNVVCKGEIKDKKLIIEGDIQGTIRKNKSNNPKKWNVVCSLCQKKGV